MSKLSAYEKRQAVYNKISQDIYNNRLKRLQETVQQEQTEVNQNKHWLERGFETVGDFFGNVISGASKAMEGIYDFGASIVGGIGGIFDQDFQDRVKEHIAYDWTTENISNPINDYFSGSYLNDGDVGRFIENVASGVGQMLPSVAVNIVAPGSGMVTLGLSATGSGTEEAFKDGAGYYQGIGYGALSGAVEMATEKLGAKLFGTSAIDDALGIKSGKTLFKEATTKGGKILQGMASEGLEEGVAELVSPLSKTIYKGTDALKEYKDKEFWGRVGESALVGAGTSLVFGETVGRINRNTNNAREALSELKTLEIKEENLHANGKLFEGGNQQKIDKLRSKYQAELSESVSKMKETKRAEFIKQNNLSSILNPDGSLIANTEGSSLTNNSSDLGVNKGLASTSNKEAYSPKFFGKEKSLYIQPTSQELTQENKETRLHINKLNKGYNRVGFVFVDDGAIKAKTGNNSKAIELNGTIYIERTADAESTQKVLATHEITHTLEGTKEMADYSSFVIKSILSNEVLAKKFGSVNKKFMETLDLYKGVFKQKYGDLSKLSNEDIAKVKAEIEAETLSEIIAQYTSESLFTDDAVIERLASENKSFLQKVLDWIKSKIERFKIKSKEDRQVYDFLRKAETKFKKALESSRGGFKSIDSKAETKYNIEKNGEGENGDGNVWSPNRGYNYGIDSRGTQSLSQSFGAGRETEIFKRTKGFASSISKPQRLNKYELDDVNKHADKLGYKIYFCKTNYFIDEFYFKENELYVSEDATTQTIGLIYDILSPYKDIKSKETKTAHISSKRWNSFLSENKNSFVVRLRTQDFLDLTADKLAQRDIYNEVKGLRLEGEGSLTDIKNDLFLEVDFDKKEVVNHEGRHRVTALQKEGYTHIDVFVKPTKEVKEENFGRIDLIGQKNLDNPKETIRKIPLSGLIKANSKEYAPFIRTKFQESYDNGVRYSLSKDSQGNTLTESQAEFFKDSKVRDENGKLQVVYHGTRSNNDFTEFDKKHISKWNAFGDGFYFTDNYERAVFYGRTNLFKTYINIKNPLYTNNKKQIDMLLNKLNIKREDVESFAKENYLDGSDLFLLRHYIDGSEYVGEKINVNIAEAIKELGFDGIISFGFDNNEYVVFESNQIKQTTNLSPTLDNDIRFSLSKDNKGNSLTESQEEYFKDSKVRDYDGTLLVMYHGTPNIEFNEFDVKKSTNTFHLRNLGVGNYFTTSESEAKEYTKNKGRVISAYLNIKNPYIIESDRRFYTDDVLKDIAQKSGVSYEELVSKGGRHVANDYLKKAGYDGVILKNQKEFKFTVVAFDSNQIKEITNIRPTFSNDIRFALSKNKDVNELVAIHNLSETKLLNSIELGGLAVPSIAVTKASLGHEDFGDISLIFSKDTIDPENPKNKIFSADAYSKRFPTTITKFKENTVDDLENKFRKSAELIGESLTNLETYFERESIDSIVERLRTKNYVRVQFLKDSGVEFEPIYQNYNVSGIDSKVINGLIEKFGEEVRYPGLVTSDFEINILMPYVSELKYDYYMEEADQFEKEGKPFANSYRKWAKDVSSSTNLNEIQGYLKKAREFLKKNGTKVLAERATDEKLSSLMKGKTEEITKYLYDLLKPYDEGTYFRNNKEIFDSYGNRRDFDEIYDKVTLASIVKYMSGTVQNTEDWSYGVGNVRSLLAKQYKTLEEIREDKDKIISSEAMEKLKDQSRELYAELCLEVDPEYSDNADEILKEIAEKPYDEKSVLKVLKKYDGTNKDPEVVKHIVEFFDQLKDYPTEYFEAKPQRAVRFDEVVKVFAPKGTDERIVKFFTDKNIDIQLYGENTPTRAELIKTLPEDIKFALSKKQSDNYDNLGKELSPEQVEFFKDSKIRVKDVGGWATTIAEDGKLFEVYHGTNSDDFFEFDKDVIGSANDMGWYGKGFYFAFSEFEARTYGKKVMKCYLNIKNPFFFKEEMQEYDGVKEGSVVFDFGSFVLNLAEKFPNIAKNLKTDYALGFNDYGESDTEEISFFELANKIKEFYNSDRFEIVKFNAGDESYYKYVVRNNIDNLEIEQEIKSLMKENNIDADFMAEFALEKNKITKEQYEKILDVFEKYSRDELSDRYLHYQYKTKEEAKREKLSAVIDYIRNNVFRALSMHMPEYYMQEIGDEFREELIKKGYDGVLQSKSGDEVVAFYENQIKLSSNKNPTQSKDIRYSLSKGQASKLRANYANPKVYSREDAERVVNEILGNGILELEDKFGSMKGKTKAEAIDKMFITLNKVEPGKRADLVRDMAEFVVNNATYEDIYEDDTLAEQVRVYETLKEYRGKLNLDYIKDEIKHRFDNKASGIVLQWGKQKGKLSLEIDSVAQELRELGVDISATNPADQLFEIIDLYTEARNAIKNKVDKYNIESFENSSREKAIEEVIREIYAGLDKYGEKSKFTERVEKYTERIKQLSERIKENFNAYRLTNVVLDKVQNIKNWKMGTFLNASKYKTEAFKKSIEALSNIKFRGNINKSGTRKILTGLNSFYDKQNPILGYQQDADGATVFCYYNEEVKFMLEELSKNSNTELSVQELGYLSKVLDYFKNFLENYNKIYRNGKFVDALPIAQKHVEQLQKNKAVKVGWWSNIFNKIFNNPKASYLQTFGDPMTVARYFDKYEDGFYTEMLGKLREGAINASVLEMEIREKLDSFLEKHKDFGKSLKNRTIKYENFEIPAQKAFLLYMTLNREQAQLGLANSGFSFEDANGVIQSVDGFNKEGSTSQWEISKMAQEVGKQLESQFTDTEKEYIKIAEEIFNEDCKEAKRETDILRTGYSNVIEDYYVPIHRSNIAKKIDTNLYQEMDRVSNASFNKDTKKGAQGELFINSLENVLDRHVRAVSQYAKLSTVIEEFDILYNLDILDNSNKPVNVKSESVNTWRDGYKYFKNLLSDMQGIPRGETNKIVAFLRSGFAKFQLGANPKVWATQFSSLFASSSILEYDSLVKGFAVSGKDVDNYCKLAKLRNYDNSAVLAQSVMDKVDKVGDFLMKPIGKTDRLVIKKLFGACQVQVEKNSGLKIGTEENKVKAGELLTKVILETQQNSLATERSNAMRSGSEFMKAITMFTADAMKMVGRFIDGLGEYSVLRAKIKQSTDAKETESLKAKLKKAKVKVVKSSVALTSSAVFMALIAQAFKWLYNKDKEDENVIENMVVDAFGNMLGGLPLIKDLYGKFAEGYDLNNYAYSAINDVLDSFNNLMNFDSKKPGQIVRDLVYALGQVLGLPARNIYNIAYGLTNKISPELGYKMNDLFYKQNYSSDLKKAIKSDDDIMISTIVDMMLNDRVGNLNNEKTQKTISELVKKGYAVLPKNVSDTITYDGESIELTKRQKENFTKIYSQANDKVSSLTNGKDFENLPAEVKAKSIKYIYDYYYEEALKDLLGVDSDNKRYLFAQAIDIVKLAKIVAQVSQVEAETDKNGKVVSGSRKAKITQIVNSMNLTAVQKYMLMGYFGYKNANGEKQVKSYIQSLKLTKTEKEILFKMCGY